MTTSRVVGSAEDFTIDVITELGRQVSQDALQHVAIDDEHLVREAMQLPQLMFYYQAVWSRITLRATQAKLRLEEAEANVVIQLKAGAARTGEKMTADEVKARVTIEPTVAAIAREHAELEAKATVIRGVVEALRQKGYGLQLVANIRGKEEDWLRRSFADRFADNPRREQIAGAMNKVMGTNIL